MPQTLKQIIVCATQRCGSTMICEDLINAGLGNPMEWFNPWIEPSGLDWPAEYETVKAKGTANGIFAVKIMSNQLAPVNARAKTFITASPDKPFACFRALISDAVWVWSRRRDTIDQAISRVVARQRRVYHSIKSQKDGLVPGGAAMASRDLPEPTYDFEKIQWQVERINGENQRWADFFAAHDIKPLTVWYEDAIDGSAIPVIASAVGVEAAPIADRNLVKLPPNDTLKRQFLSDLQARRSRWWWPLFRRQKHGEQTG